MKGGRNGKNKQPNTAKNHKKQTDGELMTGFISRGLFFVIFKEHDDD